MWWNNNAVADNVWLFSESQLYAAAIDNVIHINLINDALNIEQVQCLATKCILNDYTMQFLQNSIGKIYTFPLMYLFELALYDILFAIKSIKLHMN